jgi:hypothetical protein
MDFTTRGNDYYAGGGLRTLRVCPSEQVSRKRLSWAAKAVNREESIRLLAKGLARLDGRQSRDSAACYPFCCLPRIPGGDGDLTDLNRVVG